MSIELITEEEMSPKLKTILWGLVFIFVDLNIIGFDLMHDAIGYCMIATSVYSLYKKSRFNTFKLASIAAFVGIGFSILESFQHTGSGVTNYRYEFGLYTVTMMSSIVMIVLHTSLLNGLIKYVEERYIQWEKDVYTYWIGKLQRVRNTLFLFYLISSFIKGIRVFQLIDQYNDVLINFILIVVMFFTYIWYLRSISHLSKTMAEMTISINEDEDIKEGKVDTISLKLFNRLVITSVVILMLVTSTGVIFRESIKIGEPLYFEHYSEVFARDGEGRYFEFNISYLVDAGTPHGIHSITADGVGTCIGPKYNYIHEGRFYDQHQVGFEVWLFEDEMELMEENGYFLIDTLNFVTSEGEALSIDIGEIYLLKNCEHNEFSLSNMGENNAFVSIQKTNKNPGYQIIDINSHVIDELKDEKIISTTLKSTRHDYFENDEWKKQFQKLQKDIYPIDLSVTNKISFVTKMIHNGKFVNPMYTFSIQTPDGDVIEERLFPMFHPYPVISEAERKEIVDAFKANSLD